MGNYISRDEFAKYLADIQYGEAPTGRTGENIDYQNGVYAGLDMAYVALKRFPAADVVEVRHGEWEQDEQDKWRCSVCQAGNHYAYAWDVKTRDYTKLQDNYCPNCGCAMENEK